MSQGRFFRRRLAGACIVNLAHMKGVAFSVGVVRAPYFKPRRAGHPVPARELREVRIIRIRHRREVVVGGDRLAVVALEVQVHAATKAFFAEERAVHANDFGALFVHGGGVEIVDLDVAFGAHRMRHRAGVFRELRLAQQAHVPDAFDGRRAHFGGEALLAKDSKALLERKLKPVAQRYAVAGPVVKILVANHRLNGGVVLVGCGCGIGEYILGVEQIEALVLHRAHVEIVHRDDHVAREIVFAPIALFVPAHGPFERGEGMSRALEIMFFDINLERHRATARRLVFALAAGEPAGDQREQIRGLGEGVFPDGIMTVVGQFAGFDQVAVGKQNRTSVARGLDARGEARKHVRTIQIPGNAPEALGFALGAEIAAGLVQACERRVALGMDAHSRRECEVRRRRINDERVPVRVVAIGGERRAVNGDRKEFQARTIEAECFDAPGVRRVAPEFQFRADRTGILAQFKDEAGTVYEIRRRRIVLDMNAGRRSRVAEHQSKAGADEVSIIERLPLTLYVHVPWCVAKCPYCDFNSHVIPGVVPERDYSRAVLADLDFELERRPAREPVEAVFFGGGTPSLLAPATIAEVLEALGRRLAFAGDAEITLEANPGTIERGRFAEYRAAGINRVSLGVQSFDDAMLKQLGRIHDAREAIAAAEELQGAGIENFNLDLMHGLPGQSAAGALADVRQALALAPAHLSYYELTLEPGTAFYRRPPRLPAEPALAAIERAGREAIAAAGYLRYEISAYAQPGRRCRHNDNYWRYGDYIGIGPGAHGKRSAGADVLRTERIRSPARWLRLAGEPQAVSEREVAPAERAFEFMLGALRRIEGFGWCEFEARSGCSRETVLAPVRQAVTEGLMEADGSQLRASPRGLVFLNELQERFLPA